MPESDSMLVALRAAPCRLVVLLTLHASPVSFQASNETMSTHWALPYGLQQLHAC